MAFRVPRIKSCCCCASLETGSKIIGSLHALLMTALIILVIVERHPYKINVIRTLVSETFFLDILVTAFLMVFGVFKGIYYMIFPWILMQTVLLLFAIVFFVSDVTYFGLMDHRHNGMTVEVIVITIMSYSIMVVYNFYTELKERRADGIEQRI